MSCTNYGGIIACQPTRGGIRNRQNRKCLGACTTETSRVVMMERNPYYGPDWHCLDCGDSWDSEGLFQRPFKRAWRKAAITRHQQLWDSACWCEPRHDGDYYGLPCEMHPDGEPDPGWQA